MEELFFDFSAVDDEDFLRQLRLIDPDFVSRFLQPCYAGDRSFVFSGQVDISPLDSTVPADLAELAKIYRNAPLMSDIIMLAGKIEPLLPGEEQTLFPGIAREDESAYLRLAGSKLSLALTLTHTYLSRFSVSEVLLYQALDGLLEACKTYTPGCAYSFHAYAVWHMQKDLIRAVWEMLPRKTDPGCDAKTTALAKLQNMDPEAFRLGLDMMTPREARVIQSLMEEGATFQSVAEEFGVSPERIKAVRNKFLRKLHLPRRRRNYRHFYEVG